MLFELRLAFALNKTIHELRHSLNSEDYALYKAYCLVEGLPQLRLEVSNALSATLLGRLWGAKITPKDLIPDFSEPVILKGEQAHDFLVGWAKAHNEKRSQKHK